MIFIAKIFDNYYYLCKFCYCKFYEEPCYGCLRSIVNNDSRKPVNFEEEEK